MTVSSMKSSASSVSDVYDWASRLTAESRNSLVAAAEYYWPTETRRLHNRLLQSQRQLIAVLGCQGVGKTSAMLALDLALNIEFYRHALTAKTKNGNAALKNIKPRAIALNYSDLDSFLNLLKPADSPHFSNFFSTYMDELNQLLRFKLVRVPYGKQVSLRDAEVILGREKCRTARMNSFLKTTPQHQVLLIDLPDYSKTDRRLMFKDLKLIQFLWRNIMADQYSETNLVLFFQEETFHDHFYFGKMDTITINPFKAKDLVLAYKQKFKNTYPFTEDSLLKVATLSRGVFRRFLQYVKLCLDKWTETKDHPELLDETIVQEAITKERIAQDMDTELSQIFPKNPDAKLTATEILNLLGEKKSVNQKTIAELIEIPDYKLSRIINKLDSAGLVQTKKIGLDKIVELSEST